MIQHLYMFPKQVFLDMSAALPDGVEFGGVCGGNPEMYEIHESRLALYKKDKIDLNAASVNAFGTTFDAYFDQYKHSPFKIYDFLKEDVGTHQRFVYPAGVDFKTDLKFTLAKKTLPKVHGKPTSVEYYEKKYFETDGDGNIVINPATGNPNTIYENIICRIDFVLVYDSLGFQIQKVANLDWYREDGTVSGAPKDLGYVLDPVLDHEARIAEGKQRRQAIVDGLQLPVLGMLFAIMPVIDPALTQVDIINMGRVFLKTYKADFDDFVDESLSVTDPEDPNFGKKVIVVKMEQATDIWLDIDIGGGITPRAVIISELDTTQDMEV